MKNTNEFRDLETAEAHFYIPGPTEHCAFVKYKVLDLRACCNQPPCSPLHIDRERYFVHWPSKEAPFSAEAETIAQRWRGEIDTVDAVDIALRMCAREAFAAGRRIATSAIEQGLKNLGIDPSCGACAETFYSGSTIHMHTHPDDDKGGGLVLKCGSYDTDGLRCEGNYEHGGAHWNASSMWVTFEIPAPAPECGFCALSGCAFCDLPSATKVPEGRG